MERQLTLRGMLVGALGAIIISASSMYVALKAGALPWPTVFVALLSLGLLKLLGNTNLKEVNVTHTAMSAGAMISGGFAFTIPAIWMIDAEAPRPVIALIVLAIIGTALGVVFTALLRKRFVEQEALPYPIGQAAYDTLTAGDSGGSRAITLFSSLGLSAVFVVLRDAFGWIPAIIGSGRLAARNISLQFWLSPLAIGIGYVIGPLYTGVWFLGALLAYGLLVPVGIGTGFFADAAVAGAFRQSLGIGLLVGTGVGVVAKGLWQTVRRMIRRDGGSPADTDATPAPEQGTQPDAAFSARMPFRWAPAISVPLAVAGAALVLGLLTPMPILVAAPAVLGAWLATSISATLTGQTGINPMEILGILVLLAVRVFVPLDTVSAIMVAGVVAIACGLAGDVLNDFKAGYLLGTDPRAQIIAESIGGLVGALVAVGTFFVLFARFGSFGGVDLPAPQAAAVMALESGNIVIPAFAAGAAGGLLLYLFKLPGMTLGLGVYLPVSITTPVALGGLLAFLVRKFRPEADGSAQVIASGVLGGEGVAGVSVAIVQVLSGIGG